jgi:hypothetical protein
MFSKPTTPQAYLLISTINGLECFWGYLKRKLSAKGGIRKNTFLYTSENTSGDIITEPWIAKNKKFI